MVWHNEKRSEIGVSLSSNGDKVKRKVITTMTDQIPRESTYEADSLKIQMGSLRKELYHSKSENTALQITIKEKNDQNYRLTQKILKLNQTIHSMEQSQSIHDAKLFTQLDAIKQTISNR